MDLNIAICDDEKNQTLYMKSLIDGWAEQRGIIVRVSAFDSAENFLFHYADDRSFDILLLDIQMKKINGIELAKSVRNENKDIHIIFITGYPDYMAEGYDVSALHYLIKPVDEQKLYKVLDKAVSMRDKNGSVILIDTDGGKLRLYQKDICFIEAFAYYSAIHTSDRHYEIRKNIGDIERELEKNEFSRCHRSYIVGLRHINSITRTEIILDGGKGIPLSRRLYDKVNKEFIKYYRERQ